MMRHWWGRVLSPVEQRKVLALVVDGHAEPIFAFIELLMAKEADAAIHAVLKQTGIRLAVVGQVHVRD